ncbi:hypothetical protein CR513_11284, partial [Mucuna pruriens]
MCPTLQEDESENIESVGVLGGRHQFRRQPYLNRQFDNQKFWRQPYQPNPNQGQHVAPRFGPTEGMLVPNQANYQQQGPRYQSPTFHQQLQQLLPPQPNSPSIEDFVKQMSECNLEFQQNITTTIHDLKIQVGQLVNMVSQMQSGEELAWRGYEAVESYHSWPSPRLADAETEPGADSRLQQPAKSVSLLFPSQAISTKRSEINDDLLKLLRKVEINISLLNAIKQISKYANFLKELCVHSRKKMKGTVEMGGVVLTLVQHEDTRVGIQQILPKKCPNPCIFLVLCTISDRTFTNAMLDLRSSINVMSASIYKSLNLGDLEQIGMEIQLTNRSVVQPLNVQEDVLIQVNELIFLVDFYMLDMEDESSKEGSALILGRPFFMIAKTKIDVHAGTLSMEFGDTYVKFNIFEALKHPTKDHSIFSIDAINQFLVIIANNLNGEQEEKLLEVLKKHKKAISWTLADLPGINPSICMHKILLEEDARPIRHQQRRLNPTILDMVKKEVTKLLAAGIIYPISDSQWVNREIDRTLHRLRKVRSSVVTNSSSSNSASNSDNSVSTTNDSNFSEYINSDFNFGVKSEPMENNDRTLKELTTLDVMYQPWCIQYPQLEPAQSYELKFSLIHLLSKFHGLIGEDPYKHLKKFHVVCSILLGWSC